MAAGKNQGTSVVCVKVKGSRSEVERVSQKIIAALEDEYTPFRVSTLRSNLREPGVHKFIDLLRK